MKRERVVLDFTRMPVIQKYEIGHNVVGKMKNNPKFPEPDVTIAELETRTDLLEQRNIDALSGGKEATALLRQAEEEWNNAMRLMARYVDRIADGDATVILNAGFNTAKQPITGNRPQFTVELGALSGTVSLRRQKAEGARSYLWQYYIGENVPTNETDWVTAQATTKVSVELAGLTPMTKYWFRCSAVTIDGITGYTIPVMKVVL